VASLRALVDDGSVERESGGEFRGRDYGASPVSMVNSAFG
jgi:hypothetical protein